MYSNQLLIATTFTKQSGSTIAFNSTPCYESRMKPTISLRYIVSIILIIGLSLFTTSCNNETSTAITGKDGTSEKFLAPKLNLLTAIDQGRIDIVRQHMISGTNPDKTPTYVVHGPARPGAYPLHLAVVKNNKEIVQILLNGGAKIDIKSENEDKATPLHWATFFTRKEMVSLLIESGSSVNELDANRETPLDYVGRIRELSQNNVEKLKLLEDILTILKSNGGKLAKDL